MDVTRTLNPKVWRVAKQYKVTVVGWMGLTGKVPDSTSTASLSLSLSLSLRVAPDKRGK